MIADDHGAIAARLEVLRRREHPRAEGCACRPVEDIHGSACLAWSAACPVHGGYRRACPDGGAYC